MLVVLTIAIFLCTSGLVYALCGQAARSGGGLQNRLERIAPPSVHGSAPLPAFPSASSGGEKDAGKAPTVMPSTVRPDQLPFLTGLLRGRDFEHQLRLAIRQAGWRMRPGEFIAACLGAALGGGLVGALLTSHPLGMAAFGATGLAVPHLAMRMAQGGRRRKFNAQIPDAMALIASSMRSGHSFLRALSLVEDEMSGPLAEEFAWVLGQTTLGVAVEDALERMVEHVGSRDLELIVVAVVINMQVGGNLAEILDTIAETIRERMRIAGEISALTAEGKLSGFVMFVLPVFLALVLKMRDSTYFTPLLESEFGWTILGGALVAQILGGVIIYKMVSLDI